MIGNKRFVGELVRKILTSIVSVALLFSCITVFADLSTGGARILGVGRIQSTSEAVPVTSTERLVFPSSEVQSPIVSASDLATPIDRDVAINEPAPRLPSPIIYNDNNYAGDEIAWSSGLASAYGDGFIGNSTARGTLLTEDSMGVAVPAAWGYLLGRTIQVEYNGQVITTVVDDTGDFARLGRVLDLQPGLWRAFGFDDENAWGVRMVRYRILY
ncbi:MAG: septal ring lytic transglycosylase RlpA family protein [Coriobacteriia bacterium]|nr:septal ring lytic transglycosylase RlpA family protein [Coriobacteriia bacterium]